MGQASRLLVVGSLLPYVTFALGCTAPASKAGLRGGMAWEATTPLDGSPSLRGLAAVGPFEAWIGGSGGSLAHTIDGGATWQAAALPGGDTQDLDLRDVAYLGHGRVVAMAAGPGAASRLFLSRDQGKSWREVARNPEPEGFWDGIAFWDAEHGLLVGDPLDGRLTLWQTEDGGEHWEPLPPEACPEMAEGEYGFAASGTSLCLMPGGFACLVTGGSQSRALYSLNGGRDWTAVALPLRQGSPGAGAFSVAFRDALHGVVVGGDYLDPEAAEATAAWTEDGGRHWQLIPAEQGPRGYRSAVAWLPAQQLWWCTGPSGSEWSRDGIHWQKSRVDGMHAIDAGWMSGPEGKVLRLRPAGP